MQKDCNPSFVKLSNGDIRNGYTLKLLNEQRRFSVAPEGIEGACVFVQCEDPARSLTL